MKQLAEFNTLQEAKEYTQVRGKLVHRNTMNAWLSQANKYRRLKEIAADITNPLGDSVDAFLDSTEYNLIQSSETGQGSYLPVIIGYSNVYTQGYELTGKNKPILEYLSVV